MRLVAPPRPRGWAAGPVNRTPPTGWPGPQLLAVPAAQRERSSIATDAGGCLQDQTMRELQACRLSSRLYPAPGTECMSLTE